MRDLSRPSGYGLRPEVVGLACLALVGVVLLGLGPGMAYLVGICR